MVIRICAILVCLVPALSGAQSVDAVVTGIITDATGAGVAGVTVSATNVDTGIVRTAETDSAGRYRLPPVPPGAYDVQAERAGFRTQVRAGQRLHVGMTVTIDMQFDVVTVASATSVVGRAPMLETAKHAVSRLVGRDEIDALPVVDRNFNGLAVLAPGVTATGTYGGVDIGGGRDFQNGYNVDGVSAEGLGAGEQRVRYAQDWIREFQVLTSLYNVEFGRASGGILNAVTRSGSNQRAARVYGYFRDSSWDATPAFAAANSPLSSIRLGATAGGKLVRDGLYLFGGFEWFDDESSRVVNSSFAEMNGSVTAATNQKMYLVKLERHSTGGANSRLRYNGDTRRGTNVGVGGRVTEESGRAVRYDAHDVAGSWNRRVARDAFNEFRAAFTTTHDDSACNFARTNPPGTWFTRQYAGASLGCPGTGFGRKGTRELQLIDNLSWTHAAHDLKAGAIVSGGRSDGDFRFVRDGIYGFRHANRFDLADPRTYPNSFTRFEGGTAWDYWRWASGVFVQDGWRVAPNLTVNAGVRYDVDGSYAALNPLVRAENGFNTVRRDRDNIAPRVGVAWNVDNRTLVRGGSGIYYDENHGNLATLLLLNSTLVTRAVTLNALTPEFPFSSSDEVRRFLASALARNTVPDTTTPSATPALVRDLQVPYTVQASAGIVHEFAWGLNVSADAVFARGHDQYVIRDVNYDRTAALLENPGRTLRPDSRFAHIFRYDNDGSFNYRAMQVQAAITPTAKHVVRLSYTWSRTVSNTRTALDGSGGPAGTFGATNPFDLNEDAGPADHDIRHNASANWIAALPFGIQFSGLLSVRTALPWSVLTTQLPKAIDADPFLDRVEPRNARRGDGYFSLDSRLSKLFRLPHGHTATAFVEAFNLTNATNLSGYLADPESPTTLGRATTASERRRIQLGFRIDF